MNQLYEDLIVNMAHMKCIVKMSEVKVEMFATKATKENKEIIEEFAKTNKELREHLNEMTTILHKILG